MMKPSAVKRRMRPVVETARRYKGAFSATGEGVPGSPVNEMDRVKGA